MFPHIVEKVFHVNRKLNVHCKCNKNLIFATIILNISQKTMKIALIGYGKWAKELERQPLVADTKLSALLMLIIRKTLSRKHSSPPT